MKLLYLVHADASVLPLYRAELGRDVDVVAFVAPALPNVAGGGMSSRYAALGVACKGANGGHVLPGLVKRYPPPRPLDTYTGVYLACWSAGYALPRVFSTRDVAQVAGLVLLDSGHAARSSLAAGVGWAVEWAKLAREGAKVFSIGHSDVHTYADTASTTEFAIEVERQVGGEGGLFVVRAFDVARSETDEHVAALRGWGPGFVAEALSSHAQPDTDRAPAPAPPADFGLAVLAIAKEDLDAGIREHGFNAGPEIESLYLRPLGLAAGQPYCAAAVASWLRRAAAATGVPAPIAGSPGAKATRDQLVASKRWTPASKLTPADFAPGRLVVWDRSKPGPGETDSRGHIGIVVDHGDVDYWTIEANADQGRDTDAVSMKAHRMLGDPDLLGLGTLS